jgi:hypothetical protein
MNLNSSFVQWALKWGLSKVGPFAAAAGAWAGVHLVTWIGLKAYVAPDQLDKIQHGVSSGVEMITLSIAASVYAWLVHRQTVGVKILKAQLDKSPTVTPDMDLNSGAIGNNTLEAAAKVTGVPVEKAAAAAGVALPSQ